jgi:hypothetical protein
VSFFSVSFEDFQHQHQMVELPFVKEWSHSVQGPDVQILDRQSYRHEVIFASSLLLEAEELVQDILPSISWSMKQICTGITNITKLKFWNRFSSKKLMLDTYFRHWESVRRGTSLATLDQQYPYLVIAAFNLKSSSSVHPPHFKEGSKLLRYLQ